MVTRSLALADTPELMVRDAAAWKVWLRKHHARSAGVWLVLAKKGTTEPTKLTHAQALDEALCHGWIDGQARRRDELTLFVRFTPRRRRSVWSKRNTEIIERLTGEGRMHQAGVTEVERAKADGRWKAAYAGPAGIKVPRELTLALEAEPKAKTMFGTLNSQNRYAILYRITTAVRPETRAQRIQRFVDMLARGETIYPQKS